jgi:hypothetical protein
MGELEEIFKSCCGDFPGVVTIRESYSAYQRMAQLDLQDIFGINRPTPPVVDYDGPTLSNHRIVYSSSLSVSPPVKGQEVSASLLLLCQLSTFHNLSSNP